MPRSFVEHYDAIYVDKDYGADVAAFEALAGTVAGKRVLEIGAGTGNHTVLLAPKVRELVSLEIDADFSEVLAAKLKAAGLRNVTRYACPLAVLPEKGFDAAAAFFHVLNYIAREAMETFLGSLAARLSPGAPFVADLWNGAAALRDPPREERREKHAGATRVLQHIRPHLDVARRMVTLDYAISLDGPSSRKSFAEQLQLHLWLREELEQILHQTGFSDVGFFDYRTPDAAASDESWRLWLRARRV